MYDQLHPSTLSSNQLTTISLGPIHPLPPLPPTARLPRHPLPLPAHNINNPHNRPHSHQIPIHNLLRPPPRRHNRLDGRPAQRPSRLDRTHPDPLAAHPTRPLLRALGQHPPHRPGSRRPFRAGADLRAHPQARRRDCSTPLPRRCILDHQEPTSTIPSTKHKAKSSNPLSPELYQRWSRKSRTRSSIKVLARNAGHRDIQVYCEVLVRVEDVHETDNLG